MVVVVVVVVVVVFSVFGMGVDARASLTESLSMIDGSFWNDQVMLATKLRSMVGDYVRAWTPQQFLEFLCWCCRNWYFGQFMVDEYDAAQICFCFSHQCKRCAGRCKCWQRSTCSIFRRRLD